jgi:hypothetical protein
MEQSGRPGYVHMTAAAAAQLHREGPGAAGRPPLHPTEIKSKGTMLTAWCVRACARALARSCVCEYMRCACACVRERVRACACVCARAFLCVCVHAL